MKNSNGKWYRRLEVQLWLWAILPLTLVLVALTLTGVYGHERAMRDFVSERDVAMAQLYVRQINDGLSFGTVLLGGDGLPLVMAPGRIGERGVIYVVDSAGRAVYYPNPQFIGRDFTSDPAVAQALESSSGTVAGEFGDGTPTLASFGTVGETEWRVIIEEPVSDVIVPILRFSSLVPILVGIAVVLSLILIYFSVRTIVRPLQRLGEASALVTWGNYSGLKQEVGGVEEVRSLQRALQDMVERVRRYQDSMRQYIDAMTEGQEEERLRIARELHDDTIQNLIAASQRMQMAERALHRGDVTAAAENCGRTRDLLQSMTDDLRRMIRAMRPAYLEDLGFLPALEMLVKELQASGQDAKMEVQGDARRLDPHVELAAYRVAQEALTNAAQHAHASHINLTVSFGRSELSVSVSDDGVGFTLPESPDVLTASSHFGLVGMRERVLQLGGRLEIESQPGKGARVTAQFPA